MLFGKKQAASWIAVFLGNPGPKYERSRHNAGFMAADVFESLAGVRINRLKFNALTGTCSLGGQQVFLMKPQTYMNLSGDAVRRAMDFYRVPIERVVVVSDDVALPPGKLRVRRSGSAGGHNGLKSILEKCGGEGFPRIKIGVGAPPHKDYEMADWVIGKITGEDEKVIKEASSRAAKALETLITQGVDQAMCEYN